MSQIMIPIQVDALEALLNTRKSGKEDFSKLIFRALNSCNRDEPEVSTSRMPSKRRSRKVQYVLLGESRTAISANEAMIDIIRTLAECEPDLLERLTPRIRGSSRNHIARQRDQVYPDRPDLLEHTQLLVPGWYIGTNIANREKKRIIDLACKATRLKFGTDVTIDV